MLDPAEMSTEGTVSSANLFIMTRRMPARYMQYENLERGRGGGQHLHSVSGATRAAHILSTMNF